MFARVTMTPSRTLFFFNDTPTPEIYTLSLHDALPISVGIGAKVWPGLKRIMASRAPLPLVIAIVGASAVAAPGCGDRKSTRLNSSHMSISYAVFCLKKKRHVTEPLDPPHITEAAHRLE